MTEFSRLAADLFGEDGDRIRDDVVASIIEGERRAAEAQLGSGLDTGDAYGSIWLTVPTALANLLKLRHGAELHRPWRSRYRLPVIDHVAILAVRLAKDLRHPLDEATISPSELRRTLINLGLLVKPDLQLSLLGPDGELAKVDDQPGVEGPIRIPVLIVGFVAGHDSGLLAARWGMAQAVELGNGRLSLDWSRYEDLDLSAPPTPGTTLTVVGPRPGIDPTGFAAGDIPDAPMEIVAQGEDPDAEPGSPEVRPAGDGIEP